MIKFKYMKKFYCLLICFLLTNILLADNIRIISQSDNSIIVQRTYVKTETARYQRIDNQQNNSYYFNQYQPGNVGILFHVGYGFKHHGEIGGQLYYNFAAKEHVKFGIAIGFDYGVKQWWWDNYNPYYTNGEFSSKMLYWDIRCGIIICKYVSIGGIYGKFIKDGQQYNDGGIYGNIYMPFCEWFGLNLDLKWTKYQGFTLGGGIIIQINTKTTK